MPSGPVKEPQGREEREGFMRRAVELALRAKGCTAPNPCVGAVLVRDGHVVAEGWHRRYGGPHAEVNCLADARDKGVDPASCDLYVTLEPCNHYGRTPPCTKAVLAAGIKRVFIGASDPNPDVAGGGAAFLRTHGVAVEVGVLGEECEEVIADFLTWKTTRLPYSLLKLAMTLDGRIASRRGVPEPVSGPEAMAEVQRLRAMVAPAGAVIVGGGTLYADNPRLTCRLEGYDGPQPLAVVVTTRLPRVDAGLHLLQKRVGETIFWTSTEASEGPEAEALRKAGAVVLGLPAAAGGLDLRAGMEDLRERGRYYALCEGGGRLAMSLVSAGLAHEIVLYISPRILGDEGARSAFAGAMAHSIAEARPFAVRGMSRAGQDIKLVVKPNAKAR